MSFEIRILYVDDNPLDRDLVRDALAHDPVNFRLTEAASRAEFEACLAPGRFDLVLSDFNILGFQGLQVLAAVKAMDPRLPVVIVTGTGSEEVAVEAMKRGAADYVIKDPRHIQRLPQTLHAVLDQARQRQAAAEATTRYRELFRSVPVALYRFTLDGEVFFANPTFHQVVGLPEQDRVLHLPLTELFVSAEALAAWLKRLEREGLVRGYEAQMRRRDGALIWTRGSARAVRDEHFQVLYCEGSLEDITEHKNAEQALRQAEADLRALFDSNPEVSYALCGPDHRLRTFNAVASQRAERAFGRPLAVGDDVLAYVLPEDHALFETQIAAALAGQRGRAERAVPKPAGTLWYEFGFEPVTGAEGGVIGVCLTSTDITQRRAAEAARRESETRYQLLAENMADVVWVLDVDAGRFEYVSPSVERLRGYSAAEVLTQPMEQVVTPASLALVQRLLPAQIAAFQAGDQAGTTTRTEIEQTRRDGSTVWTEVVTTLVRSEAGRLQVIGVSRDSSARRQAEAALRYQANLVAQVSDAVMSTDAQFRVVSWNPAAEAIYGWTAAEIIGQPVGLLVDPAFSTDERGLVRHEIQERGAWHREIRHRHKDGRSLVIHTSVTALRGPEGQFLGTVGVNRDITAQKQAEAALRYQASLLAQVSDAVISADAEFNIVSWNPAAEATYGWTAAEAIGQPIRLIIDLERDQAQLAARAETLRTAGVWRGEIPQRRRDGTPFTAQASITALYDPEGVFTGTVTVNRDISARQQAEAALRASELRYRSLVEAQADLVMRADPQLRVTFVNAAYGRAFGVEPAAMVGESLLRHVPAAERDLVQARLEALLTPPYESAGENRNLTMAGERWVAWINTAIRDEAGQVVELQSVGRDVTERRHAEAALQRYQLLADYSRDPMLFVRAADGQILEANAAALEAYGYSAEALRTRHIQDLRAPQAQAQIAAQMQQAETGAVTFETVHRRSDGREFPVEVHSVGAVINGERVLLSVVRDITVRKQAELALQASEIRYRRLFDTLQEGLALHEIICDAAGRPVNYRFLEVNPAFETVTGLKRENLAGRTVLEVLPETDPRLIETYGQVALTGQPARLEPFVPALGRHYQVVAFQLAPGQFATLVTDITERRAGEAVLRRYQLLSEHTQDSLLFLRAADGRIIEANRAALEAYGYTADEIRARRIHDLRAPHTLPEIDRQLAEAQENTLSFETVHRRRDGREFPVEVHVIHAVLDAEPILLSTVRDITARRAIEAALRESEARFRGLAETAPDAILVADAAGRLLFFNPAAEAIFGYAPAEVLGRLVQTWLPAEPRAAADDPAPMLAALGAVLNHTVELLGRRKSGEAFPLELSLTRVQTANGEVFTSIIRDISERKRIEATLRLQSAALNAAANAIVITNRAGAIEWVNPAFSALTGYPFAAAIHHTPRLLKSGRHAPEFYQALWETIAAGRIWSGELVNRRQDGQLYDEEQTITPVLDETGRITHFVAIKQDISVRKQRERELEAVARLSSALRGAVNRAAMPAIILDQVARLLEARGTALALHEEATPDGQQQFGFGEWVDFTNLQFPPDEAIMRHVLETGRPYIQDDIRQDPRFYHGLKVADLYAVICLPMLAQRQMIGTLWAARPKPFHDADVRVLASLAEIAANALHRAALHEQTVQRLSQLQALRQVDRAITSNLDARLTLEVLLEQVAAQLGVDAADILLLDPQWQTLTLAGSRGWRGRPFAGPVTLDTVGPGPALLERRLIVLPDLTATPLAGERAADLAQEQFVTYVAAPLVVKGQVKGVLELFHRAHLYLDAERLGFLEIFADQAAIAVENAELFQGLQHSNAELRQAYDATIEGWSRALDLRDKETEGHTRRVTEMTMRLARALGMTDDELVHVRRGALLHDIGKMGVPDGILLKPGPLTAEEWSVMRQHPQLAYDMLAPIAFLWPALEIPYCHHEKWDGTGYPRGLAGDAIPLAARLFAVADVWDALRSDRPYRPAWPVARVVDYIRAEAGRQFDPRVVDVFLKLVLEP